MNDPFTNALKESTGTLGPEMPEEALTERPLAMLDKKTFDELFVIREKELQQLGRAIGGAITGLFKQILLVGEKGVGKTTLATYLILQESEKFECFPFSSAHYEDEKVIYNEIVQKLVHHAMHSVARDMRENPSAKQKYKQLENVQKHFWGIKQLLEDKEYSQEELDKKIRDALSLSDKEHPVEELCKITQYKPIIVLDETPDLLKNQKVKEFIDKLQERMKATTVHTMHPETYKELLEKNSSILKDACKIEIPALTTEQCKQMLELRMKQYDVSNKYGAFTEAAVEYAANASSGNPLRFIHLLRRALIAAKENKTPVIDTNDVINANQQKEELKIENEMHLKIVKILTKGSASRKEISKQIEKTEAATHGYLKELKKQNIVDRERNGLTYIYFIKKTGALGEVKNP